MNETHQQPDDSQSSQPDLILTAYQQAEVVTGDVIGIQVQGKLKNKTFHLTVTQAFGALYDQTIGIQIDSI